MKKALKIIENVILELIIVILCGYLVLRFTKKVEIYKVETGSMEEGIHAGDYLLIMKQGNYEVDDVVTFEKDGKHITHRIIRKNGNKIVTKGDANNTEDGEIDESAIIGKLLYKSKLLNFVINFKYAIISLCLAGYLITCYFEKKDDDKKEEEVTE